MEMGTRFKYREYVQMAQERLFVIEARPELLDDVLQLLQQLLAMR
jgi:hypothetical protein